LPLQNPSVLQLGAPRSLQWLCGSWLSGTLVHVPALPASAHDWQAPVQALPQHTPCAQNPDTHSAAAAQALPVVFFTQLVPMHVKGAVQSAVVAHDVLHTPVPQVYGSHIDVAAAWQTPVPLHDRDDVSVAPVQVEGEQVVPLA
jgi:hypothetical protein